MASPPTHTRIHLLVYPMCTLCCIGGRGSSQCSASSAIGGQAKSWEPRCVKLNFTSSSSSTRGTFALVAQVVSYPPTSSQHPLIVLWSGCLLSTILRVELPRLRKLHENITNKNNELGKWRKMKYNETGFKEVYWVLWEGWNLWKLSALECKQNFKSFECM